MLAVKVFLGGEGNCELGGRADGNDRRGVIEALLLQIEPSGWIVGGALKWQHIRKFKAGGARELGNHRDTHNVRGLALHAWEAGCEVMAFVRDVDAESERRADAIARGIEAAANERPEVAIIGGGARPALEGWILALLNERNTDEMSRARTLERLRELEIVAKKAEAYVEVVEAAKLDALPPGCDSLTEWIAIARARLGAAIHGTLPA